MSTAEIIREIIVNRFKPGMYPDAAPALLMCAIFNRFNPHGLTARYDAERRAIITE